MNWLVNCCARLSCERWNSSQPLRRLFRKIYQLLGEQSIRLRARTRRRTRPGLSLEHDEYRAYPWPYADPKFATWSDCDETARENVVLDPSGFVAKHCTSYCAWKLRELHGDWPKNPLQPDATYHAKDWQDFLRLNGFDEVVQTPALNIHRHYIGIDPSEGEYGQVYWYDHYSRAHSFAVRGNLFHAPPRIYCSTYDLRQFTRVSFELAAAEKLIWVCVDA